MKIEIKKQSTGVRTIQFQLSDELAEIVFIQVRPDGIKVGNELIPWGEMTKALKKRNYNGYFEVTPAGEESPYLRWRQNFVKKAVNHPMCRSTIKINNPVIEGEMKVTPQMLQALEDLGWKA